MAKKIIIIGGGIAGLSAGIYGQRQGFETTILEMSPIPGGQCTAWERKGYRFDYCLHWLVGTNSGAFNTIWKDTGVLDDSVKIIDHHIHTRMFNEQGEEFIIYASINQWEKYLLDMAPEDEKAIRKMCREMRMFSKLEPFDKDVEGFSYLTMLKSMSGMMPALWLLLRHGKKDVKTYINGLGFKNPRLVSFFDAYFGPLDFSSLAFLMMLAWFDKKNAGYLEGGSLPLILRMVNKYQSLGGNLQTRKKVEKIQVENDKATGVILQDGSIQLADYIVSAADGYTTIYKMLGGKYLTKQVEKAYTSWPVFTPIVQVSLGVSEKIETESPSEFILSRGTNIGSTAVRGYSFMNYQFDSTLAPAGKTSIIMRFDSPWENWKDLTEEQYREEKKKIEKDALQLFEKRFPGISRKIEVLDIATPRTNVDYTGVWKGAYEGFLPTSKNLLKSIKMNLPGLSNFYMIGQWLTPGGGLPPSAQSGKTVISRIRKLEGVSGNKLINSTH